MTIRKTRRATLTPWYHVPKPRCITTKIDKMRCTYSAIYEDKATGRIQVCKIHADMLPEIDFRKIKTQIIYIDNDPVTGLASVTPIFKSAGEKS